MVSESTNVFGASLKLLTGLREGHIDDLTGGRDAGGSRRGVERHDMAQNNQHAQSQELIEYNEFVRRFLIDNGNPSWASKINYCYTTTRYMVWAIGGLYLGLVAAVLRKLLQ